MLRVEFCKAINHIEVHKQILISVINQIEVN